MSKTAVLQILELWTGSHECDPDAGLLARFLTDRDEDAFAALVQRHGPLVYGTCRRILGNPSDTDDAFQAVFFVLARRAPTLRLDRSIGPWLHGVAVRVAKKLRGQIVQRRLRDMAAARSERVEMATPNHDFWAIIDEELARLARPLLEVLVLCDLGGQSHAQTAASLGLAKGTITKRLAKARAALATRLQRRGITLGVGALSTRIASQAPASVPAPLLLETARQAVAFSLGQAGGCVTAKTLAEGVMRSLRLGALKVWFVVGLLGLALTAGGLVGMGDEKKTEPPRARADTKPEPAKATTVWRECFTGEYQSSLPVSVALSADGKTLLHGDTNGEVMAVKFPSDPPTYRWKAQAGGSHAVVAYSADQKQVYATTTNGVCIFDAATGKSVGRIDEPDSNPVALGVFPDQAVDGEHSRVQIVFGNARGYFVKSWVRDGKIADTIATLETSTVAKGAQPADAAAVPLAVDPKGRSAILTGPRDATGAFTGVKGKNVLWAYVCGNYEKGSPGNRVLAGHAATVVCAAWAKEGSTAVTGDADGRAIVWDARSMKEIRRVELGGRVLAVALAPDGAHTAACVRGKQGGEFYAWETAKPANALKPIHTQQGEFGGEPYASLAFGADGNRLAGCVIDKKWLPGDPRTLLSGQVHVWELAAEPKAQLPPLYLYTKDWPKGSSANFAFLDNFTLLTISAKEGAVDLNDIKDGHIQARLVLGNFVIGRIKLCADRKWFALEQHPVTNARGVEIPAGTFDVGVYAWPPLPKSTIPSCQQLLDIARDGKVVAVVRDKQLELWDTTTVKRLKAAPFKYTHIDAASFSPDGQLLALSNGNELVLWRWAQNADERIDLRRRVGSLTFTPDGRFLAEGPVSGESIHIRDLATGKVVQTLAHGTKQLMNVPRLAYTQGGRVLIACDNITATKDGAVPHRVHLWDTATGSLAHPLALPAGVPTGIDVTPNGRYLAAMADDGEAGMKLSVWRLDGRRPVLEPGTPLPAAAR
jgi:RNA polymerase sigma factor (sigma-70 family)